VLRNVFTKTLRDQRRPLGWWSLGLVAVIAIYMLPYRAYLDAGVLNINTNSALYQALGYDTTPAGYLQGTLFALLGPLLLVMMAVTVGARAIAGDEEAGTLDLLLAHPVSRTRLLLERFGALAAAVTWLGLIVWAGTVAAVAAADMGIAAGRVAATSLGLVLLALGFGTVALAISARSGRRGLTLGSPLPWPWPPTLPGPSPPRSSPWRRSTGGPLSTTTWAVIRCAPAWTSATWRCWPPSHWS
jgi:ABC-2 type transport system permease protein